MLCVGNKGMEGIIDLFANVSSIESIKCHPVLLFEFTSQMRITRKIPLYTVIKQPGFDSSSLEKTHHLH